MTSRLGWTALAASLAAFSALALGEDVPDRKGTVREIYDTKADAKALIASAVARAKRDNQRVLVMYGGNWCGWCHKLHDLFEKDPQIAKLLLYEYRLVMVDIGRFDRNLEIAEGYGAELKGNGVPYLTVLAADGKPLANQDTGSLEDGPRHDPARVKAFLEKWKATPEDAEKALKDGLARAAADKKLVFLHFGAPWCGFCRKLDEFLELKQPVLDLDYLCVKVDTDRMLNGQEVAKRFMGGASGIPWFAILDAEGKKLADGDGPKGNIGYPVEPEEIAHFIDMLEKTARKLPPDEIEGIRKALEKRAQELRRPAEPAPKQN